MQNDIKQTLLQAAEGLLYPSESDYPFEYFIWPEAKKKLSKKDMQQLSGLPSDTPVKVLTLEQFFEPVTSIKDWYEEEEKATANRFVNLKQVLEGNLTDIQVFKAGKVEAIICIAGKDGSGTWMGLSTKVVET